MTISSVEKLIYFIFFYFEPFGHPPSLFVSMENIIKLNARHYKILDYCVAGLTVHQIAEKLTVSTRLIELVVNSPSFQHELAIRRS